MKGKNFIKAVITNISMMQIFRQCTRCVLDTTVKSIVFDENGVCNFCHRYDIFASETILREKIIRERDFDKIVDIIKKSGQNKPYDCILGLSGGVDSSYLALVTKDYGLRPLVVHFDNGWNTELAVKNIENIVNKLGLHLHTHVIDWDFFRNLQVAYLKSSVVDIEVPTDQLIFASLYKIAKQYGIKFILSGMNVKTEGILPEDWHCYRKRDFTNLKNIFLQYGNGKFSNSLCINYYKRLYYEKILSIQNIAPFYYLDFDVEKVKERLICELSWKPYLHKHYESVFTRFYQGYILPRKFNIDKRKAHLSSLIVSGQILREDALSELNKPTYPLSEQESDKLYIIKKLNLSNKEFENIMEQPVISHDTFGYDNQKLISRIYTRLVNLYLNLIGYPFGLSMKPISKLLNDE